MLSSESLLPALVEDQKAFGEWTHDPKSEGGGEPAPWKRSSADPGRRVWRGGNKQQHSRLWQGREESMAVHLGDFVDLGNEAVTLSSTLP